MDDCIKKEEKKIRGLLHLFGKKKYLQLREGPTPENDYLISRILFLR
jgi:hypothetical protein